MQTDLPPSGNHEPAKGLPPVVPLSGKYLAQLFFVPGIIVVVAVLVLLGFSWLAGSSRSPEEFVKNLENSNPDVRWRAASDLAEVLRADDALASDPHFTLKLAELLRQGLAERDRMEKAYAEQIITAGPAPQVVQIGKDQAADSDRQKLMAQRSYVLFLGACLGNSMLPVGVPLLTEMATTDKSRDAKTAALIRRRAVWALANLGENRKRFENLSPERRAAARERLQWEADQGTGERAGWANLALQSLSDGGSAAVIAALAECARSDDPFLREMTAFALNFWEGSPEDNRLAEQTLLKLSRDNGHGNRIEIDEGD